MTQSRMELEAISAAQAAHFLAEHWSQQSGLVVRHRLPSGQEVWLKRAGVRHGMAVYRMLGGVSALTRMPALRPVPNLGGQAAIAIEVQRLRSLAAAGVRVPQVLAAQAEAFLMSHLGAAGQHSPSLADEIETAARQAQGARAVALWQEGLHFLASVHAAGQCLSQAFARNLVRCADGALGAVDFEDDPSAVLPLALCQLRDVLAYVHSTAEYLQDAGALPVAKRVWQNWLAEQARAEWRQGLGQSLQRLAWLRYLPSDRRWGRDVRRLRTAYALLAE